MLDIGEKKDRSEMRIHCDCQIHQSKIRFESISEAIDVAHLRKQQTTIRTAAAAEPYSQSTPEVIPQLFD